MLTRDEFLEKFPCKICGRTGIWYDVDFDVDSQGEFEFSANCKMCNGFGWECGNIYTYEFKENKPLDKGSTRNAPWDTKYFDYPCPYCGKYTVRAAKWDDKSMSVAFWGIFSQKLHSNYKCDACKKMWE